MRRVPIRFMLGLLLCLPLVASVVHAEDFMVCWDATGFFDSLRVWAEQAPDGSLLFALKAAEWNGPGPSGYRLRGHGSASLAFSPTTPGPFVPFMLSLDFDNDSTAFGGNPDCQFRATISRSTLQGSLTARCTGGAGPAFTNTTQLTFIDCDDVVVAPGQSSTASVRSAERAATNPRFGD
jgi:hypothetical protein